MEDNTVRAWYDLRNELDIMINQAVQEKFAAGISLLIIKDDKEVAFCSAGYSDIENNKTMDRNTICRLYSLSKPIAATAIMILLERGQIDLNDPVSRYLSGFENQFVKEGSVSIRVKREVTIKDLLSMTSGLPYGDYPDEAGKEAARVFEEMNQRLYSANPMTTQEVANRLGKCRLSFQPGERWQYGTSADILGAVIEVISGTKLGEFLRREIFHPLHMEDTGFFVPPEKQGRLAKVYETKDNLQESIVDMMGIRYQPKQPPEFESCGGGLLSTIDDYSRFATMLIKGGALGGIRVLATKTAEFLTTGELLPWQQESMWKEKPYHAGYTYGNLMRVLKCPGMALMNSTAGEYGWSGAVGTYFANTPSEKLTVLLMMQKKGAGGTTPLTRKLMNVINSTLC